MGPKMHPSMFRSRRTRASNRMPTYIGGIMGKTMNTDEWQIRCDLAACYRLVDMFGWSDLINTRITARIPGSSGQFLINPYGLLFEEITASSLVKIDAQGVKVGSNGSDVNSAGFAIPSAVHIAR